LFFRTIRFRLTLWYTTILAAILAASGFIWHTYLARELQLHIDEKLRIVAADVAAFHLTTHGEHILPGEPAPTARDHCQGLEAFIRYHNWGEFVQMLDDRGSIHCTTSNLKGFHLPLTKIALQQALRGEPHYETIRTIGPTPIRLLTYPVMGSGKITDLIQVGEDLGTMESALEQLRLLLLIFSPAALLVLGGGGWFLAGRVLSPVSDITQAARQIKAENLGERLPVGDTRDEIADLAETFNSMLARLEDSFNKVRQFSADASHELRTPLAILKGETEVALRWGKDPEELRRTLLSNLEEIDRMGRIIEDLLLLAKSEAGELRLQVADLSLGDLLQEIYLQGRVLGEAKQIDVTLNLQVDEDIRLRGDQFQLHRMLLNLITNAIKYTPDQGRVEIGLAVQEHAAVLSIADSGIGIAPEHLPHIFERFYRVDTARNREIGGTGLGLAIVRSIVEAHDGRIEVSSTAGRGTTFVVSLPLAGPAPRGKKSG
jgi:heavy metal sensor kinase